MSKKCEIYKKLEVLENFCRSFIKNDSLLKIALANAEEIKDILNNYNLLPSGKYLDKFAKELEFENKDTE